MQRLTLRDQAGRKYLNRAERRAFRRVANQLAERDRLFCLTLLFTGCRITEALNLVPASIDGGDGVLVIESLKKRRRGVLRTVPVPDWFCDQLAGLTVPEAGTALFSFCRHTGNRIVKSVMATAGICGTQATAKGLRHGFGVACVQHNIPLNLIQRWLGHASAETTAIYLEAVGDEERQFASRLWT